MGARIILAMEHDGMRKVLRRIIDSEPDMQVAGESDDPRAVADFGLEAIPDVMIIDADARGVDQREAVSLILKRLPGIRVLALSVHSEQPYARQSLKDGVFGYLLKGSIFEELVLAVRAVMDGRVFVGTGPDGWPLHEGRRSALSCSGSAG